MEPWLLPAPNVQKAWDKASAVPGGREESKAEDLDLRVYFNDVTPDFNNGNPRALIKAFKRSFRVECPNTHWFLTLDDARSKMEDTTTRPIGHIRLGCRITMAGSDIVARPETLTSGRSKKGLRALSTQCLNLDSGTIHGGLAIDG